MRDIIGTTSKRPATGFSDITIGLALTLIHLIHLISIPITNTSANPARSTAPALFADGGAIGQLWLLWIAPIAGAMMAGLLAQILSEDSSIVDIVVVEERRGSQSARSVRAVRRNKTLPPRHKAGTRRP